MIKYRFIRTAFTKKIKSPIDIIAAMILEDLAGNAMLSGDDDFIAIEGLYSVAYESEVECTLTQIYNQFKIELFKRNDDFDEILEPTFTTNIVEAYKKFKAYYDFSQREPE